MSCCTRPDRALLVAIWLLGGSATAGAAPAVQPLWLSVHAGQGEPSDDRLLLADTENHLWASGEDLDDWGLAEPTGHALRFDDADWYRLDAQPHLQSRFDPALQALWLEVDPQLRRIQLRDLSKPARDPTVDQDIEPGGWIDSDLQWTRSAQDMRLAGLFGARIFNSLGFGATDLLLDNENLTRLDSTWSIEHPEITQRLDLGDGIVRPGAWGRAVRFGGVSFGTDFSLQPDLVTFPQARVSGVASLPSTLDLYVNGQLARRETVDAGPFVLSDVPVQSGQNQATVVVRDLLGREQILSQPFYAVASLLRPGLSDTRIDAGWLRRAYALQSFDYGSAFVSGGLRRGFSEGLTAEARGEWQRQRQAAGGATTVALPFGGLAELVLAISRDAPGSGSLVQAGASWEGRGGTSLGLRWRRPSSDWTDLGEDLPSQRIQTSANLGWAPVAGWSTSLTWVRQTARDEVPADLFTLGLGTRVGKEWFLNASLLRTRQDSVDTFASLSLAGVWGRSTNLVETQRAGGRDSRAFEWQRNPREVLDDRYRLRFEDGASRLALAESEWTSGRGRLGLVVADRDDEQAVRAGASTRVAWLGRDLFWTRADEDGFAVIDTQGLADVGVLRDNRLAARTDRRGLALLTGLRPYQDNRVGLVDADIPIDAHVQALERIVTPSTRGGIRIDLGVRDAGRHGFRLAMPDGRPLPARAKVHDPATGLSFMPGQDGQVVWPHGEAPDRVEVEIDGQRCTASTGRGAQADAVQRLRCGDGS
ncbi:MAG: fimbria/pilus outer membrane usher protein [Panacagrimonas sp.]